MTKRFTMILIAMVAAAFSVSLAQDAKPDPQEKLETAIPEAIRLIEAKEYAKFLKSYVAPEDLKKIAAEMPLDEFAKFFGEKKAEPLLKMLKAIKGVKPTLDADGKKATFKVKDPIDGRDSISFQKVDKRWYIQN